MPSLKKIGKYRIIEKIATSNYAELYAVADNEEDNFILKLARTDETTNNELIVREFGILSQIKHPNIVRVYDYAEYNGQAYFTLEFIPGKPINEYFRGFSEDFAVVILQILSALGAFHNKGFVHCDLKPENILYDANERQAKLIDFGFAGLIGHNMVAAGTLTYMAPEVIKGIAINQRSDLYSLGVIIYEILSGKPFKGTYTKIRDIPEEIGKLLTRLVSAETALRPTIPELYQTFTKYAPSTDMQLPAYEVRLPGTAYVETIALTQTLQDAVGEAMVVVGETGLGKTRLLQELKFHYLTHGYEINEYAAKERTSLMLALHKYLNRQKTDISKAEDKFQIFEEINQALLRLSQHKKVVVMIDDIDHLSDYDKSLIRYLGYGIKESSALLIGTSTNAKTIDDLGFKTIALSPLSENAITELLNKTFGEIKPTTGEAAQIFPQWLHQQSGGNPLVIVETLKTLYDKELLFYRNNQWQVTPGKIDTISVPKHLEELIEPRIEKLHANEISILQTLYLANHPLPPSIITDVSGGPADAAIEHLKNVGLVREEVVNTNRYISISSKIIANSVAKKLDNEETNNICNKIITAIEKTQPLDTDYASILAEMNSKIGNMKQAYKYYKLTAENAEKIYDYDTALLYYTKIAEYVQRNTPKSYAQLQARLANVEHMLGNNDAAIKHYEAALQTADAKILAKANAGLGRIYSSMGKFEEAIEHLGTALDYADRDTAEYVKIANPMGYTYMSMSRLDEAVNILTDSLSQARKIRDPEEEADTLYYLASLEWYKGSFQEGIEKAEGLLKFCQKHKLLRQYAFCASLLGSLYQQTKNAKMVQKYINTAIQTFEEVKRVGGLAGALNNLGLHFTQQGKLKDAQALFEKALHISQKIDNKSIYRVSITNIAIINSQQGSYDKAIEDYDKVLQFDPEYIWAIYGKAMILLEKGKYENAVQLLNTHTKIKHEILYKIGLATLSLAEFNQSRTNELLSEIFKSVLKQKPDISIQIESYLKSGWLYHEMGDFENSSKSSMQLLEMTAEGGKEYNLAHALLNLNDFALGKVESINIEKELSRLKEIGCIYDYAYLVRLQIDAKINRGLKQAEVGKAIEELNRAQEIFESIGAELELNKLRKTQGRLFPLIVEDYSRRVISEQYLETFSGIAELISSDLGDEHFVQNILDLVIKATNAERGALFVKTTKGMDFVAGRNMDKTTIKDAGELSHTAIKHMEHGEILFAQDALSDPTFNIKKSVMLNQIHSLLCIPLSVSDNVIGAIYLDSRITSGIFGPQDKDFLMAISKILASVIEKSLAFRSLSEENILLKTNIIGEIGSGHLMGKSRVMKEVYRLIDSVGETNSPVLILGETGTGKGMIARLIHLRSKRKKKKFLSINCGTIPETLLESELFGHKKGAFTGAISDKKGLLEEGEGGTVFLDEITNTSLEFQGKLLEAIEEKIIRRVGETTTRNIDVRFLFATNKDLEIEVEDNRFRRDLFYRINVFKIEVPPLRDRAGDIPFLAQFFLERYVKEINKKIDGFAPEAMQRLREYFWPGNVRELQNVIERAVVLAKSKLISMQDIGFEKTKTAEVMPLKQIKKEAVIEALNLANWNITKAAKMLSIGRRSLHRYIKKFNIVNDSTISIGRKS
jgi:Nif-specific regulatory protein